MRVDCGCVTQTYTPALAANIIHVVKIIDDKRSITDERLLARAKRWSSSTCSISISTEHHHRELNFNIRSIYCIAAL